MDFSTRMALYSPWKLCSTWAGVLLTHWVYAIELAHSGGEAAFRGLYCEMVVIGHLVVGMSKSVEAITDRTYQLKPGRSIRIEK